jgi:hypothetical protein
MTVQRLQFQLLLFLVGASAELLPLDNAERKTNIGRIYERVQLCPILPEVQSTGHSLGLTRGDWLCRKYRLHLSPIPN